MEREIQNSRKGEGRWNIIRETVGGRRSKDKGKKGSVNRKG